MSWLIIFVVNKKILLNQYILTMWPEPENMNYTIKEGLYGQYYHAFSFSKVNRGSGEKDVTVN